MPEIHVVVGGQFGSEGKGHFTAELAKVVNKVQGTPLTIRTGGPNAGHTVVDDEGHPWKLRQVPATAVVLPDAPLAIASGAEIDEEVLTYEIGLLEAGGFNITDRLWIDGQATIIDEHHKRQEQLPILGQPESLVQRVGSTGKGIGAARAARIMREATLYDDGPHATFVIDKVAEHLASNKPVIIEATQGFGLGLHAGWYPKCTSRDIRAIDVLAEVGISPWQPGVDRVIVWVVFRPYPIRVAGDSGPLKGETTWEALDLEAEYTTVTQKIRRVGAWDAALANRAMLANGDGPGNDYGEVRPILMFADHIDYELAGCTDLTDLTDKNSWEFIKGYERDVSQPWWGFGTGPNTFIWRYKLED